MHGNTLQGHQIIRFIGFHVADVADVNHTDDESNDAAQGTIL